MNKTKFTKDKGDQNTNLDKSAAYSNSLDKHVRTSAFNHESVIRWLSVIIYRSIIITPPLPISWSID